MRNLLNLSFLFILALSFSAYAQQTRELVQEPDAKSEQRTALVIGNAAYETSPLRNPVNDARAIAQSLKALGFQVILKENINQTEMKRAVREFGEKIKNGGVGLFYFAGHGVQVKGQNYLVPIGATITKEEEVEYEGVDVGFVMAQMEAAKNRMNIVILDACRNNPFARSYRSESSGLASINAPSGTLIAYATAPGSVASDGDGANGLYTQELLFNLRTAGLNIEEVFKRVRIAVREKTQNKQTPWESSSLTGDFYFVKSGGIKPNAADQQIQIPVDSTAVEIAYWNSIKDSKDTKDFKAYLEKYPNGQFADIATRKILIYEGELQKVAAVNALRNYVFTKLKLNKNLVYIQTIDVIEQCKIKITSQILNKLELESSNEIVFDLADINTTNLSLSEIKIIDEMFRGLKITTISGNKIQSKLKNRKGIITEPLIDSVNFYFPDSTTANEFIIALTNGAKLCRSQN